jgi:HSP20 family protein
MSERLRRLFELMVTDQVAGGRWRPPADVYRTGSGWLVKLDLAGVRPDDIELKRRGRRLVVRGVRRDSTVRECQRSWSMEIAYSQFERAFDFPEEIAGAALSMDYRDGMLLVRLEPSAEERGEHERAGAERE